MAESRENTPMHLKRQEDGRMDQDAVGRLILGERGDGGS
jgi:hypothetical protein